MADRYYTNFKVALEDKYGMNIIDVLMGFKGKGMSYLSVASETGFHINTIRIWCYKYSIKLNMPKRKFHRKCAIEKVSFIENFKSKSINIDNILSRRWV